MNQKMQLTHFHIMWQSCAALGPTVFMLLRKLRFPWELAWHTTLCSSLLFLKSALRRNTCVLLNPIWNAFLLN